MRGEGSCGPAPRGVSLGLLWIGCLLLLATDHLERKEMSMRGLQEIIALNDRAVERELARAREVKAIERAVAEEHEDRKAVAA